jgi:hypothetical protein
MPTLKEQKEVNLVGKLLNSKKKEQKYYNKKTIN